jgi:hypothetical protein
MRPSAAMIVGASVRLVRPIAAGGMVPVLGPRMVGVSGSF